jgi:type IV secretion system protein VirB10
MADNKDFEDFEEWQKTLKEKEQRGVAEGNADGGIEGEGSVLETEAPPVSADGIDEEAVRQSLNIDIPDDEELVAEEAAQEAAQEIGEPAAAGGTEENGVGGDGESFEEPEEFAVMTHGDAAGSEAEKYTGDEESGEETIIDVESESALQEKEMEQVSPLDWGRVDEEDLADSDSDMDEIRNSGSARKKEPAKKVTFSELRNNKKVPRLKKTFTLFIIAGAVAVFLLIINIALSIEKKEKAEEAVTAGKNTIRQGTFSVGDYRGNASETEVTREPVTYINPEYTGMEYTEPPPAAAPGNGGGGGSGDRGKVRPRGYEQYSETDLQAAVSGIGKDTPGYGLPVAYQMLSPDKFVNGSPYYGQEAAGTGEFNLEQQMEQLRGIMGQNPPMNRDQYTADRLNSIGGQISGMFGNSGAGGMGAQMLPVQSYGNPADTMNNGRFTQAGNYNPNNGREQGFTYLGDDVLFPGTIIHAVLVSQIDTDYPGPIHARVMENVYDSKTGRNLLIPQGSILQGDYSSSSIGVAKVQVAWNELIVNYENVAYQVSLGGMAGVDRRGRAGISGTIDDHYFEWLKAAGIMSIFTTINSEISYSMRNQNNANVRELMDQNQAIVNRIGNRIMERAFNIQPTVRVRNGKEVSVSVNTVVRLRPFEAIKAEARYVRR